MYASDFKYDGRYLSDFGFMICSFNSSDGLNSVSTGSVVTFNTTPTNKGKYHPLTNSKYEECVSGKFSICKVPCYGIEQQITDDEFRFMLRWLNRAEFHRFNLVSEEDKDTCYFDASFNLTKVEFGGILYGIELSIVTNRPFGYGNEKVIKWSNVNPSKVYTMNDYSDEIGYTKPYIKIVCNESGNLEITNTDSGTITSIKNVIAGEIITLHGDIMQIETSNNSHNIGNDFNYKFPRIVNSIMNKTNRFTFSLSCNVELKYSPIIKNFL